MATKQPKKEVKVVKVEETVEGILGGRKSIIGEPVKTDFDERTPGTAPFLREDGSQDNGA